MTTMFVVSFHSARNPMANGVYGVYSTRENAFVSVGMLIERANDEMYDYNEEDNTWCFFTEKGTWEMKPMVIDETEY